MSCSMASRCARLFVLQPSPIYMYVLPMFWKSEYTRSTFVDVDSWCKKYMLEIKCWIMLEMFVAQLFNLLQCCFNFFFARRARVMGGVQAGPAGLLVCAQVCTFQRQQPQCSNNMKVQIFLTAAVHAYMCQPLSMHGQLTAHFLANHLQLAMPCRSLQQRSIREQHVNRIVCKLTCVLEADGDHVRRMVSTNRLIPLGSFKSRSVACLFGGWAAKFRGKGRCMTKKLAMLVCKRLRLHFDLEPGTKEESERFLHLLQAARKKRLRKPRAKTAAMDTCETQPMDLQDIVLDPSVCLGAIVFRPQDPVFPPEVPEVHNIEDDYVDYAAQHDLRMVLQ